MRITIEPTNEQPCTLQDSAIQHKVVVETPHDDLTLDGAMRLLARAMYAYGFNEEQVQAYLKEVADE